MDDRERASKIIGRLEKVYSNVNGTVLNFSNPLELLISTILKNGMDMWGGCGKEDSAAS